MMGRNLKLAISDGPKCPSCGCEGFDDWWHEAKSGGLGMSGRMKCHGCGQFFSFTAYDGGTVHSSIWQKRSAAITPSLAEGA